MPNRFAHFAVGSSVGLGIILSVFKNRKNLFLKWKWMRWIYQKERWWMLYAPFFIMIFGLWAVVPDLLFLFGIWPKGLTHSSLADIFFCHGIIETIEDQISPLADRILSWAGELICILIYGGCIVSYILFIQKIKKGEITLS